MTTSENVGDDDIAQAAARDVARMLDRRGLQEVVALASRVLLDPTRGTSPTTTPRPGDPPGDRCTLRQHERPTRRSAADRTADDDRA
ncbi:MAG: hypothetical protein ACRDQ0_09170 [Pseudonocardia sp.]